MYQAKRESLTVFLPDGAGDEKFPIFVAPSDHTVTIEKATFIIPGGLAAGTAAYLSVSLENGGTAGTGTTDLGGTVGGTVGWSDNVPQSFLPAAGSGRLTEGQVLVVDWAETGGIAPKGLAVTIDYVHGLGVARN